MSAPLIDTAGASAHVGVPARTLAQWRYLEKKTGPPYYKVGRAVRYSRDELDKWLAARRRTA